MPYVISPSAIFEQNPIIGGKESQSTGGRPATRAPDLCGVACSHEFARFQVVVGTVALDLLVRLVDVHFSPGARPFYLVPIFGQKGIEALTAHIRIVGMQFHIALVMD